LRNKFIMKKTKFHIKSILFFLVFFPVLVFSQNNSECEPTKNKKAQKIYEKAIDELSRGAYQSASEYLTDAVDEEPDFYEAYFICGFINTKQTNRNRKLSLARESFLQSAEICPSHENYYANFYLGDLFFGKKDWENTVKYLKVFIDNVNLDVVPEKDDLRSQKNAERERKRLTKDYEKAENLYEWAEFYYTIYKNQVPFEPKPIEGLSTPVSEYQLIISPDNELAFFARKIKKSNLNSLIAKEQIIEKFFSANRNPNGKFDEGKTMPYPFNVAPNTGSASITIDNKTIYIAICKYISQDYLNCDICQSELSGEFWLNIMPLDSTINSPNSWESTPSITSDGKTLYFVSDRAGGYGGTDIYKSTMDTNGFWGKAINLGPSINTPGNELSPFIHTDSRTLYFSSGDWVDKNGNYMPGHKGLGNYDIFYIRLGDDEKWTEPKNIGYPINSEKEDLGFFVSTDGKTGYFASNRINDKIDYDLYMFELYKDARPEDVLFLKGQLKDEKTNKAISEAKIEIKNVKTKEITEIPVDNETGKYAVALLFKNDYVVTIKKEDYAYETKYIAKKEKKYQIPVTIDFEIQPLVVGHAYPLNDIYFATNSDSLTESSKIVIDGFIDYLKDFRRIEVAIHGHTDAIGSNKDNLILSNKRAKAVYNYMIEMGIASSRLRYKGFGEEKPIAINSTEEGKAKNRRTEFVIIRK